MEIAFIITLCVFGLVIGFTGYFIGKEDGRKQEAAEWGARNKTLEPLPVLPPEYVVNPADRARELVKHLNECFQELHSEGVEIHILTVSSWEDFVAGEEIRVYDEIRLDLKRWERV